jgi:hypothetical protein
VGCSEKRSQKDDPEGISSDAEMHDAQGLPTSGDAPLPSEDAMKRDYRMVDEFGKYSEVLL